MRYEEILYKYEEPKKKKKRKSDEFSIFQILLVLIIFYILYKAGGIPGIRDFLKSESVLSIGIIIFLSFIGYLYLKNWSFRNTTLREIDNMSGQEFEKHIGKLLVHRGFHIKITPGSGDKGVDIVAKRGNDIYSIQVKRSNQSISRRAVSDAVGGIKHYGCNKAMVITNSYFSQGAIDLAKSNDCELIDRDRLLDWINESR